VHPNSTFTMGSSQSSISVTPPKNGKVIIIGGGPSGLVALKELREKGFDATVLEKAPGVGGAFRVAYDHMFLTISTKLMAYSDFAWEGYPRYAPRGEYVEYLERYVSFFQLGDGIQFNTTVTGATLKGSGKWEVESEKDGKKSVMTADRLIIATGSNHNPKYAPVPGYTGEIMHSSDWRNNKQVAGKRVMIIGNGESSADIAADASETAKSVVLWARRAIPMGPRFLNAKSNDELTSMEAMQKGKTEIWEMLETITVSQVSQLQSAKDYSDERLDWFEGTLKRKAFDTAHLNAVMFKNACASVPDGRKRTDQIFAVPKSLRMVTATAQGKMDLWIAKKAKFEGKKVTFTEFSQKNFEWPVSVGTKETYEPDVIIMCTGFKTEFEWLKGVNVDWNCRNWFKNSIPPGYEEKLAFLGWTRPHQGGIPACSEMLSRYLGMIWTGEKSLPKNWEQQAQVDKKVAEMWYLQAADYHSVMDYPSFMTSMSELIGCEPVRPSIFNPKRLFQFYTFPMWPAYYRTRGPAARPEIIERDLQNHGMFEAIGPQFGPNALTFYRSWRKAFLQVCFFNPLFYVFSFFGYAGQGMGRGWYWAKSKKYTGLHGLNIRAKNVVLP
jgi:dimethylaniline monooxygenase (N-oxide forming)